MKLREGRIPILSLLIAGILTIVLMYFELNSKHRVKAEYFDEKIAAAELTQQCFRAVKKAADELNIPIDRINDPNETGLIGLQYSPITTERGDLNAKLTSTNPNFAAVVVMFLKATGIRKGDVVAVSFTGSLPALNIAVLSTMKILQLEPIIITSVGSSMWGANYPQFTYLDMERVLNQKDLVTFKTTAASIGGEDDVGRGLSPEGRESIETAILRNNIDILNVENLEDAISKRIKIFGKNNNVKLFINAGERITALAGIDADNGIIKAGKIKSGKGIIAQFSQSGIPVINLSDINQLAEKQRLPVAPIPMPEIGKGGLYYEYRYSVIQAILSIIILVIVLFIIFRFDIEHYLKRRKDV